MEDKKKVRLLVVDDSGYCEFMRSSTGLWHAAYDLECEYVESAAEALEKIAEWCPTIIMLDAHLADMNCMDFLEKYKETGTPIVVMSEHPAVGLEESVIARGGRGCISKTNDPDEFDFLIGKLAWLAEEELACH